MSVDSLHWRQARPEIQIQKQKHHVSSGHIAALRRYPSGVPEGLLVRGFHAVIVGIERLESLTGVVGIRRSRHVLNGVNLSGSFPTLVRNQWIFQAAMVETNRLRRFFKQIDDGGAAQAKGLSIDDEIQPRPALEQQEHIDTAYRRFQKVQQHISRALALSIGLVETEIE